MFIHPDFSAAVECWFSFGESTAVWQYLDSMTAFMTYTIGLELQAFAEKYCNTADV